MSWSSVDAEVEDPGSHVFRGEEADWRADAREDCLIKTSDIDGVVNFGDYGVEVAGPHPSSSVSGLAALIT
jgi:hypothetical protein